MLVLPPYTFIAAFYLILLLIQRDGILNTSLQITLLHMTKLSTTKAKWQQRIFIFKNALQLNHEAATRMLNGFSQLFACTLFILHCVSASAYVFNTLVCAEMPDESMKYTVCSFSLFQFISYKEN